MTSSKHFGRALIGSLIGVPMALLAYPAPPPDPSLPTSEVPATVQQIRREMLEEHINSLSFHNMDEIFTTRTVARSGQVWPLQRADHARQEKNACLLFVSSCF